jgi:dephospho-CoA kinase
MKILGITGGIGSGKSTFCRIWEEMGAHCIDVDQVARDLVQSDPILRNALKATFGADIYNDDGILKRETLAQRAFVHEVSHKKLNDIVWPVMIEALKKMIETFKANSQTGIAAFDMAVLYESGFEKWLDGVIVVHAPEEKRKEWLMQNRRWNKEKIERRIQSQFPVEEKMKMADWIVWNSGTMEELREKARKLYREILT